MNSDPTNDTDPAMAARQIEGYRQMTCAQRLKIACDLTQTVRDLALSNIRLQHPQASERELLLRLASRCYGPEVMLKFFGWDVNKEGY